MKHQIKSNPAKLIDVERYYAKTMQSHFENKEFIGRSRGCEVTHVGRGGVLGNDKKTWVENGQVKSATLINPELSLSELTQALDEAREWANIKYLHEVVKILPIMKKMAMTTGVHWKETTMSKHEDLILEVLRNITKPEDLTPGKEVVITNYDYTKVEKGSEIKTINKTKGEKEAERDKKLREIIA